MGEPFKPRNKLGVFSNPSTPGIRPMTEPMEHRLWRMGVLENHKKTSDLLTKTITDVRGTKKTVRNTIRGTRQVLDSWGGYSDEYSNACKRFKRRINKSLQREEIAKLFMDNMGKIHTHHRAPTKCYLAKKQAKIALNIHRKPFSGY